MPNDDQTPPQFTLERFRLDGRVALVIGGGRGIGLGIAWALHAAGARLALAARSSDDLDAATTALTEAGADVRSFVLDATVTADVRALIQDVARDFGALDILVNSAGMNIRRPADQITEEDFDRVLEVNTRAMFFACQEAARVMRRQGRGGRILNIASGSDVLAIENIAPYAISKAGVRQMTRSLAYEWAADGITVNAIAPGRIRTAQTEAVFADPVRHAQVLRTIPLGRAGYPEDCGGSCVLLLSDAGEYITGQTIAVDGGWNLGGVGA